MRQGKQNEEKEVILRTLTGVINTAFKKGYSLSRWCKVHNIMLEKDQNDPKLHRLRVIHIIEADYNLTTKILWSRKMMWEVEKKRLISDGQWGNRSGRSPCDVALTKELHYELLNTTLKEYASMENDAKACYNRMVPNLILLVSRSLGMSKEVCQTVGKTFKRTAHHVMTKAGESTQTFG